MFGSVALEVVIGLAGTFLIFSLIVSGLREAVAKLLQTRSKMMWSQLKTLLDGGNADDRDPWQRMTSAVVKPDARPITRGNAPTLAEKLANHPFIEPRDRKTTMGRTKISQVDPRAFARTLLDILADGEDGAVMTRVKAGINELEQSSPGLHRQLNALLDQGAEDIEGIRSAIETWFESHMASLSAWYRRETRWVGLVIGVAIAFVFNINAIAAVEELWENASLRDTAVAAATSRVDDELTSRGTCSDAPDVLACVEDETLKLIDAGFPFGWDCEKESDCDSWWAMVDNAWDQAWDGRVWDKAARVAGWVAAAAAFSMGATFWFDVLKRLTGSRTHSPT